MAIYGFFMSFRIRNNLTTFSLQSLKKKKSIGHDKRHETHGGGCKKLEIGSYLSPTLKCLSTSTR